MSARGLVCFCLMIGAMGLRPGSAVEIRVALQTVQFSEDSFDKSNFQQLTAAAARKRCDLSLQVLVTTIAETVKLSDDQQKKLELAGQVNIHRFFYSYSLSKRGLKFGTISRNDWQAQFIQANEKLAPLKQRYVEGLHGESSLFQQTLVTALDSQQYQRAKKMIAERRSVQFRNYIGAALAYLDRKVPISVDQRTKITELLLERTEPPASFGEGILPLYEVLSRLESIEDELKEMFTDQEYAVIQRFVDVSKRAAQRNAGRR